MSRLRRFHVCKIAGRGPSSPPGPVQHFVGWGNGGAADVRCFIWTVASSPHTVDDIYTFAGAPPGYLETISPTSSRSRGRHPLALAHLYISGVFYVGVDNIECRRCRGEGEEMSYHFPAERNQGVEQKDGRQCSQVVQGMDSAVAATSSSAAAAAYAAASYPVA